MPSTTPVRDVMTTKVVTLRPDQTFEEAADVLADNKIGAAPVVDADGRLVGMLRDEDLIISEANLHAPTWFNFLGAEFPMPGQNKRFEEELQRMVAANVEQLMHREFVSCSPDDVLADAATKMADDDSSHLPVVDGDGKLVGIIARGDVVRRVARET